MTHDPCRHLSYTEVGLYIDVIWAKWEQVEQFRFSVYYDWLIFHVILPRRLNIPSIGALTYD